jgi:hypothetical protein
MFLHSLPYPVAASVALDVDGVNAVSVRQSRRR